MKDPVAQQLLDETRKAIKQSRIELEKYRKHDEQFRRELADSRKRLYDAIHALQKKDPN